jgi:hypothetical protein
MTKISGSGSISQRHESADSDPHQNVMDPQHCQQQKVGSRVLSIDRPCLPTISQIFFRYTGIYSRALNLKNQLQSLWLKKG